MKTRGVLPLLAALTFAGLTPYAAQAEPYLAARMGMKCVQCHVNPTGGGLRNPYGNVFAQTMLPAGKIRGDDDEPWTGMIGRFLSVGGNLRANYEQIEIPGTETNGEFSVEEGRIFVDIGIVPGRLSLYFDERVAPGNADSQEANVRLWLREGRMYVKAGRMYLPFGWRLEDDDAFVRQLSGIGMTVPDDGVELGLESGPWSMQLAVSNGAGGAPEQDSGKQFSLRTEYVREIWRFGISANTNDTDAGDRHMLAAHGAVRTGPVVWLGEVDYVDDDSFGLTGRKLIGGLAEANWLVRAGHNLKLSVEYLEPDDDVDEDEQNRASLVYEFTPFEFLQFRAGARIYDGIPQNDLQNREQYFLQLHGFF